MVNMDGNSGNEDLFDSIVMADERSVFWKKNAVCLALASSFSVRH